jgi:hypothetical protein
MLPNHVNKLAQISAGRFRIDAQVGQSKKGTPVYSGYIDNDGGGGVAKLANPVGATTGTSGTSGVSRLFPRRMRNLRKPRNTPQ